MPSGTGTSATGGDKHMRNAVYAAIAVVALAAGVTAGHANDVVLDQRDR